MSEEMNALIGHMWQWLAEVETSLFVERVESAANIADAPSQDSFEEMDNLGAVFCEPSWPPWSNDIWARTEIP